MQLPETEQERSQPRIFYGWWIVLVGIILRTVFATFSYYGFSAFFNALVMHFGWSRAAVAGVLSLARLEGGFLALPAGYLFDRIGPRKMMFVGITPDGSRLHTAEPHNVPALLLPCDDSACAAWWQLWNGWRGSGRVDCQLVPAQAKPGDGVCHAWTQLRGNNGRPAHLLSRPVRMAKRVPGGRPAHDAGGISPGLHCQAPPGTLRIPARRRAAKKESGPTGSRPGGQRNPRGDGCGARPRVLQPRRPVKRRRRKRRPTSRPCRLCASGPFTRSLLPSRPGSSCPAR